MCKLHIALATFCLFLVTTYADDYPTSNQSFPTGFSLGVATAAYQVEGAWNESGKGESIWDWFTHTYPEKIEDRNNGDIACDSYHKWEEDLKYLKDLGVDHYRLSLSWPRIFPDGLVNNNSINQEGVDYYRSLLEGLKNASITPYVTLYHWDLPLSLHQMGGWQNPELADHFAAYARECFKLFGDLVKNWMTLNEPETYCVLGYATGDHAPGYVHPADGIYKCAYVSILAHAKAYHVYDEEFRSTQGGRISIVVDSAWYEPQSNSTEDQEAAQRQMDFSTGLYANAIYNGNWPEKVIDIVDSRSEKEGFTTSRLPKFTEEELKYIKGTSDFFCLNSYATYLVHHQSDPDENIDPQNPSFYSDLGTSLSVDPSWASSVNWVYLVPEGFRKLLNYINTTFKPTTIVVTENGWAQNITTAGTNDQDRITYINQYLSALLDAVYEDKINITGYTVWSLMDNLEWSHGYQQKLGLIEVDFSDPERTRTPKDSYSWYKNVTQKRCLLEKCG